MNGDTRTPEPAAKFEVGQEYYGRFSCNYHSIVSVEIVKRTEKSVWFEHPHKQGEIVRRRISKMGGGASHEYFMPFGSYSMAMLISADRNTNKDFNEETWAEEAHKASWY